MWTQVIKIERFVPMTFNPASEANVITLEVAYAPTAISKFGKNIDKVWAKLDSAVSGVPNNHHLIAWIDADARNRE